MISAAVQQKTQVIGVDADQSYLAPTLVLTSAEKKVNTGVFTAIKNLMNGQFSSNLQEDINNGGVGIGKIGPAGAAVRVADRHDHREDEVREDQAADDPPGQVVGRRQRRRDAGQALRPSS